MSKERGQVDTIVLKNGMYRRRLADIANIEATARRIDSIRGKGKVAGLYMESEDGMELVDDILPEVELVFDPDDVSRKN